MGAITRRKFVTGPGHIFNPVPTSDEEVLAHGNALAESGNYPVGTSGCFNVGISGGCGPECYLYREGRCDCPEEMIPRLKSDEERQIHQQIYPAKRG
jgi:hypothetical protein